MQYYDEFTLTVEAKNAFDEKLSTFISTEAVQETEGTTESAQDSNFVN